MSIACCSPCSSVYRASNASEYLVPSWKTCPTSMPRSTDSGFPQRGADVARLDRDEIRPHVDREVAPEDRVAHVVIGFVRPGDPGYRRAHGRIRDDHADVRVVGPDVALREVRMRGEVVFAVEMHRLRRERGAERVFVDLAVAGHEREAERAVDIESDGTSTGVTARRRDAWRRGRSPACPGCAASPSVGASTGTAFDGSSRPRRAASTLAA